MTVFVLRFYLASEKLSLPITFLAEREDVAKSVIAAAIEEWTNKTCLQFKERTSERAYVTFRIGSGFVPDFSETNIY